MTYNSFLFLSPVWLYALIPAFLIIFSFYVIKIQLLRQTIHRFALNRPDTLLKHFSFLRITTKIGFFFLAIFFLILALARPSWGKREEQLQTSYAKDVMFLLDISQSMLAQDGDPDRLTTAKKIIKKLVTSNKDARFGLILFSSSCIVQCPLTADVAAFLLFLDNVDEQVISGGSTMLMPALTKAIDLLQTNNQQKKLLVLISDGEDFSTNIEKEINRLIESHIQVCTIGVGTKQGVPIPTCDVHGQSNGYLKDAQGKVVISQLRDNLLRHIAQSSRGKYIHISEKNYLDSIQGLLKKLEKNKFEYQKQKEILPEKYAIFIVMSFICFLIEWLL